MSTEPAQPVTRPLSDPVSDPARDPVPDPSTEPITDNTGPHPADSRTDAALAGSATPGDALTVLGWDEQWAAAALAMSIPPELAVRPGRVARIDRGRAHILTHGDHVYSSLYGAHTPPGSADLVTGDWVLVDDHGDLGAVLPRRTAVTRGGGRRDTRSQVLAANVDVVLVVIALTTAPNLARLDRMLTVAWASGAQPVVALTKADLCATAETERDEVAEAAVGVPVHLTSTVDGRGLEELRGHLAPGRTVALLGVSGVGKSSLVNALSGTDVMAVGAARADGKGRHTTTSRDLVVLPDVGVLIDTPGLRGVQMWDAEEGLGQTFADVEELMAECRYRDCRHRGDDGCALATAVADGRLSQRRLDSYVKLQREITWLQSRYDARLRAEQRKKWRTAARSMRGRGHR